MTADAGGAERLSVTGDFKGDHLWGKRGSAKPRETPLHRMVKRFG
jgi:hypothetical protein